MMQNKLELVKKRLEKFNPPTHQNFASLCMDMGILQDLLKFNEIMMNKKLLKLCLIQNFVLETH